MKETPSACHLHIPASTLVKIFLFSLLFYAVYLLLPFILLLFFAAILAITLNPLIPYCERVHLKRGIAVALISLLVLGLLSLLFVFVIPTLATQIASLLENFRNSQGRIAEFLPEGTFFRKVYEELIQQPSMSQLGEWLKPILSVGQVTVIALLEFGLVLALTAYMLLDGERAFAWFLRFFKPAARKKMERSAQETSQIVFAYVAGQAITSLLAGTFAFSVLKFFNVPAAFTLAVMAAVFDILPILGFFIFTVPAVILALSVSPSTAFIVLALYLGYHAFENYFIVPKVYGNRMKLSSLAVLIAITAGGLIAGIPGAIAALPIVAAYPILESIWWPHLIKSEDLPSPC